MPSPDPADCPHATITGSANTHAQVLLSGAVGARLLTVEVRCADCGLKFWFPGLGTGTDYTRPVTSTDGFALIAPIVEAGKRNTLDPSLVSVSIRTSDVMKGLKS